MSQHPYIRIRGARQNNLKNIDLDIPIGELVVVTGPSGSGKSSLVFDTLYAEGQRRYVETFSPYARQFLDRMDKPQVDAIEGVPPAIAIDQSNQVRTSRSTVGTMTELADYLKLLYARASHLYCKGCGVKVERETPQTILASLAARCPAHEDPRLAIVAPLPIPENFTIEEMRVHLERQGFTRITEDDKRLLVTVDRFRFGNTETARVAEALESALRLANGKVEVHLGGEAVVTQVASRKSQVEKPEASQATHDSRLATHEIWKFSADLHCAECDIHYATPSSANFSFNSAVGACETCKGFGRVVGIDPGLIVPDESKTLAGGAVKPWQSESYHECQDDLMKMARLRGVATDIAWRDLPEEHRIWVMEGEPEFKTWQRSWPKYWYGVRHFFDWLETKAYKMHIRVLLSRYRAYTDCPACAGARLKTDSLLWRIGSKEQADVALGISPLPLAGEGGPQGRERVLVTRALSPSPSPASGRGEYVPAQRQRFRPTGMRLSSEALRALPGLSLHDTMTLPIERARDFFRALKIEGSSGDAVDLVMNEIRGRLSYLCEVGLAYLSLDRQSRTLSGGEVQRINLTTALGTSLVNTLFVLDEPSIGLHPRDIERINGVMRRLRDAGNSLVVVEHDPAVMLNADRIVDIGPGPGAAGGHIVFNGTPEELLASAETPSQSQGRPKIGAAPSGGGVGDCAHTGGSLTAQFLSGQRKVDAGLVRQTVDAKTPRLRLLGATANNLKNVDLAVPLGKLVCVTGVSGSGKSTLIQDVLYPALKKAKGEATEAPGAFARLEGDALIEAIVMVDQSQIGKTTRSNPASYVGAFDVIRKRFAALPEAEQRGYTAGTFSFNSGDGRCPTCGGNGFEHVEMQFLSDVYLRCPDCDGTRYRPELLELQFQGKNIAEVLELTCADALAFFSHDKDVVRSIQPLVDVGLDYLTLGQPVPTLSGGEAQRLKLAGHLAEYATKSSKKKASTKGSLFLFDEPTTGLHFGDIEKLLRALRALVDAGNTVLVVEHNLDVMRAADWLIDLGPEGGDGGGEILVEGTVEDVIACTRSHTGRALAEDASRAITNGGLSLRSEPTLQAAETRATYRPINDAITITHAREHNLKNISLAIQHNKFTVVTGVSGSGKSTLAFDILFAEGQRRYLESLNAYARQFVQPASKPDVDAIHGIPPTVAIEQRTSRGGRKSTVGTLTEVHHFLRLLFVKLGTQHCPDCQCAIEPQSQDAIAARLLRDYRGQKIGLLAPLVVNRKGLYTDLAKWAKGKGYTHLRVDGEFLPVAPWPRLDRFKEHNIELPVSDVEVRANNEAELREKLAGALGIGKGTIRVITPDRHPREGGDPASLTPQEESLDSRLRGNDGAVFSTLRACPSCGTSFPELDPRLFSYNSKHGWCESCCGTGVEIPVWMKDAEVDVAEMEFAGLDEGGAEVACRACHGERLNPVARAVRYRDASITDYSKRSVDALGEWVNALKLTGREAGIGRDIMSELKHRLAFLHDVGLGYLALERGAPTLSGGEAQRIRLASQLGSNLRGVCYVLDEPSIGLHPRDNGVLLDMLEALRAKGNTVVVVEHDEETIRRADEVLDLGPGAGTRGGHLIAQGTAEELIASPDSVTGRCLRDPLQHPLHSRAAPQSTDPFIVLTGGKQHNLQDVNVRVPLNRLTVVTGVSGSGKSTLARDVLHANLKRLIGGEDEDAAKPAGRKSAKPMPRTHKAVSGIQGCERIEGWQAVGRVLEVDQTPIGKTPRSCPATYVGFWDEIRKLYAGTETAKLRGWSAARFSFNTGEGRCPACEGAGQQTVAMSFLPDVKVHCEVCNGQRFNPETLSATWRDKSIAEVLAMEVDEAVEFFAAHPKTAHPLRLLQDVGLGYLTLGQASPTLSGGEAQRIKLVTELSKVKTDPAVRASRFKSPHTLYVLDEPTVGLHMADVAKLITVLHRLVEAGNTALVIEHDLDVMAEADWLIDMGPEGGDAGGRVVYEGPLAGVLKADSHTGRALKAFLKRTKR
ncbi:excinuclease ABC subunit UvrA [Uliginosibacterium flavum]|uniref:UvrABC system protein A n=1 Tax=Uliginosibacterium flavum TaxID=1396831 RepID=A0ABV2TH94_9RHOO